ncbi:MAG: YhjD/YihY/BrkB family envelope integrity protein [Rhodospirillales bacterium]
MPNDSSPGHQAKQFAPSFLYGDGWGRHGARRVYFVVYAVTRDFIQGLLPLHASSLVYTTLLSVVPLLALAFSVVRGLGGHNQLAPLLKEALAPIGPMAKEVTERTIAFVDNVNVGVLGAIGVVFLIYTSVSVVRKLEDAANAIWHVSESRSIGQSFTRYLTVIVVGPILLFSAFALTGSIMSSAFVAKMAAIGRVGEVISVATELTPVGIVTVGSVLLYWLVPNAPVRFRAALVGGVVAGLAWGLAAWGFSRFVAGSTSYTAIYSAFAALILLLIWLNVNWLILLVGCAVSFYVQYPRAALVSRSAHATGRMQERVAFSIMQAIGEAQYQGDRPPTIDEVVRRIGFTRGTVCTTLERLEKSGLIAQTGDHPPRLVATKPLEETPLTAVWEAVRMSSYGVETQDMAPPQVRMYEQRIEAAVTRALDTVTLKDLAIAKPNPGADEEP